MEFGVNLLAAIPVRQQPSDKSEMISQLLFGELVKVLDNSKRKWLFISCEYDNYEGWVSRHQIVSILEEEYMEMSKSPAVSVELSCPAMCNNLSKNILFGSSLPRFDEMGFTVAGKYFSYGGQVIFPERLDNRIDFLERLCRKFLNAPYQWGGRSPYGVDCSGFVQVIFKCMGIRLPRDASQQISEGELVDFVEQTQLGDLAYFSNPYKDNISHVGIVLETGQIIHASEFVRIDRLDHHGIYNQDLKKYTHKLIAIKRVEL